MSQLSTRRFELGLPLFRHLNLGLMLEAQALAQSEDVSKKMEGVQKFMDILCDAGAAQAVRKLSAIWTASDVELLRAESDSRVMLELEEKAAESEFADAFMAACSFQAQLLGSLQLGPSSSEAAAQPKARKSRKTEE